MTPPAACVPLLEQLLARLAELEPLVASLQARVSTQAAELTRLQEVVAAQEAELVTLRSRGGGPKNSQNSSLPPSHSFKANRPEPSASGKPRGAREGHRGISRCRTMPDRVVACHPPTCRNCGRDLSGVTGHARGRSQQVELPPVRPVVIEVVCYRCTCPDCGSQTTAAYPEGWDPRQHFGWRLQTLLAYLHHHQHIAYARLCRMLGDLWGVSISQGALGNSLSRIATRLEPTYQAIRAAVCTSRVVGSDETPQRVGGQNRWDWVVQSTLAVCHFIAKSRAARELAEFYGDCVPEVQECDLFSAQLASPVPQKAVCHAHQLRDLRYAEEHGDTDYAPKMSRLIRLGIGLAHRRARLAPDLFAHQVARIKRHAHQLGWGPLTKNPFGQSLQQRFRRHEAGWWLFLEHADVNPTNNASERAIREAVVHRKVLGSFRSEWGADAYARFLSITQTAQKRGLDLLDLLTGILVPPSPATVIPQPDG